MKIKEAKVWLEEIRLNTPYSITNHQFDHVDLVMLELKLENGIVGIGSASPAEEVVHESARDVISKLEIFLSENVIGKEIRSFESIIDVSLAYTPFSPGLAAALDIALHDCFGKYVGKSVVDYYGRCIDTLPTSVTIGILDISETLKHAKNYKSMGFSIFKLKTGMNVEEDIEKVIKLTEEFGRSIKLRLDANQGYSKASLVHFLDKTKDLPIELIEQPLPKGNENELMTMTVMERNKFVADESLMDKASAMQWSADPKPFGIFNIKLMKCGGIRSSRMIADIANQAGISLFWGCNDESICSISAALHAAYIQPHTKYLDLDGSLDLQRDVVEGGFELKNGDLILQDHPGLGIRWR